MTLRDHGKEAGFRGLYRRRDKGFSVIELLVVLVVIAVLTVISFPYVYNYTKLYASEEQAFSIMDVMEQAGQRALSRRRTVRFEIDLDQNAMLIIDENASGSDELVKSVPLKSPAIVRVDAKPANVSDDIPLNYNDAVFAADGKGHEDSEGVVSGHTVWAARFRSDGTVVNAANLPLSANLYTWPPNSEEANSANSPQEVRAITVFGGSGAVRYWKYNGDEFNPY